MDTAFTLISFVIVTGLVGLGTWLIVRRQRHDTSTGYFLAGRSLGAIYIAFSLLLTNLSTEQLVGLNGAAFKDGLSVMAWEVVSVLSLVLMALFFLPKFLRSGISTVPQFLELRFDHTTQVICNIIFLVAYTAILLPIILYTGATGLNSIVDVKGLFGFSSDAAALWFSVWLVGIIGSLYAILGGMRGIAVSDTFNGVLLLTGGFLIVWFGLDAAGKGAGMVAGLENIVKAHPEKLNSLGGPKQSVPFSTLFTGVILLTTFYWCTNQQIIQRTFAAKNLSSGQKGVLLTGALKLLGPLYLVLPGIIALHLFTTSHPGLHDSPDLAYGLLVKTVLPPWLTGFFLAAMAGAVLSSFCGALNSTSTLFSLGIYRGLVNKDASELQVVRAGKTFSTVVAVASMMVAPLLMGQTSIFAYLQKMNALYFIPIFSVVLMGLLLRRMPAAAAKVGLVMGVAMIAAGYFIPYLSINVVNAMHEFHFIAAVFAVLCATMLIMTKVAPRAEAWVHQHSGDVEMVPWRWAKPAAAALVVIVLAIYVWLADTTVLKPVPAPLIVAPAAAP
jgi:solute:Na+ symporter, SSS family